MEDSKEVVATGNAPGKALVESHEERALTSGEAGAGAVACANCGMLVTDRYCGHCGQRLEHHVHSVGELLGEAAEVITHADSRVWRTFVPLMFRPGFLTQQYLAGRRASYLPPFRLYIVLSVLFFLMVSLSTPSEWVQLDNPAALQKVSADSIAELQKEIAESKDPQEQAALRAQLEKVQAFNVKKVTISKSSDCEPTVSEGTMPAWLHKQLVNACERVTSKGEKELKQSMIHNAGRAMFVFLPLIAAMMKLVYWRPRRHYVEHLLLLLHNHAFFFLSYSLLLALQFVVKSERIRGWCYTALWLYFAWYLFKSMRRVYGQGRARTLFKFAALAGVYLFFGVITFAVSVVYSFATL